MKNWLQPNVGKHTQQDDKLVAPKNFEDIAVAPLEVNLGVPEADVLAWQDARRAKATTILGAAEVSLYIGWPESEITLVPVAAAAAYEDNWEVLSLYGSTHRFTQDEVARVQDAA